MGGIDNIISVFLWLFVFAIYGKNVFCALEKKLIHLQTESLLSSSYHIHGQLSYKSIQSKAAVTVRNFKSGKNEEQKQAPHPTANPPASTNKQVGVEEH